jgi:hypothetical protein
MNTAVFISNIKHQIKELESAHKFGKNPGYACGWTDACDIILGLIENEKQKLAPLKSQKESEVSH